jgi:SAM-dependent methyltransferase
MKRRLPQRPEPPEPPEPARFDLITGPINLGGLGLEIGPSWRPLLRKADGYNVRVADHLDQAGLIAKYDGVRPTQYIEPVDYVLNGPRLTDTIDARFDWIVASHVLEHTVCLIKFLQEAEALLLPGGVLSLAVPDRRYCFDRFRERTSLGRVIDVFHADRLVHSEGSVLEFHVNYVAKGDSISWDRTKTGAFRRLHSLEEGRERAAAAAGGEYVDVHNWVFTPNHLRLLLVDLEALGFIGLRELAYHETVGSEFYLALSRDGQGPGMPRQELVRLSALELYSTETIEFEPVAPGEPAPSGR